jgi:serine protease Do
MDSQRTKLGIAFSAVALGGIALGFAVSARLNLTGRVRGDETRPAGLAQQASLPPTPLNSPDVRAQLAPSPAPAPLPQMPAGPSSASFSGLVKAVGPAVVHIQVAKMGGQGLGTGFVISSDGFVMTNEHVVGGADQIVVKTADGESYSGKLVGADEKTDLALLKVEPQGALPTVTLGDSDTLDVGDWVIAIGSPLGLDHTVTAGIVSAKQRHNINPGGRASPYEDFIQTDAAINPGNSGGPLINVRGEVVGINSAVSTQGQGLGFAIPINMAKTLLPQLKQGQIERSWLGVSIGPVPDQVVALYHLPNGHGAYVADVDPNGPSRKAGLERGDVILTFDGKDVETSADLPWLASTAGVGKTVQVVVASSRGKRAVKVTLERNPY